MTTTNQSTTATAGQNSALPHHTTHHTTPLHDLTAGDFIAQEATKEEEEEDIEDAGPEGTRQANRLREEEEDRLRAIYGDGDEEATK